MASANNNKNNNKNKLFNKYIEKNIDHDIYKETKILRDLYDYVSTFDDKQLNQLMQEGYNICFASKKISTIDFKRYLMESINQLIGYCILNFVFLRSIVKKLSEQKTENTKRLNSLDSNDKQAFNKFNISLKSLRNYEEIISMHFTILESLKIINESSKSIDEKQKLLLKAIIDLVCFNGGETYGKLYHVPFINVCNEITKLFINDKINKYFSGYRKDDKLINFRNIGNLVIPEHLHNLVLNDKEIKSLAEHFSVITDDYTKRQKDFFEYLNTILDNINKLDYVELKQKAFNTVYLFIIYKILQGDKIDVNKLKNTFGEEYSASIIELAKEINITDIMISECSSLDIEYYTCPQNNQYSGMTFPMCSESWKPNKQNFVDSICKPFSNSNISQSAGMPKIKLLQIHNKKHTKTKSHKYLKLKSKKKIIKS